MLPQIQDCRNYVEKVMNYLFIIILNKIFINKQF